MDNNFRSIAEGALDENAIKKAINSNSVYGAYGGADVRPTCMNDQVWMDICKPYLVPLDVFLARDYIISMVGKMISVAGHPDTMNLRVLAGASIMAGLSPIPGEIPERINRNDGLPFVYDKRIKPREMRLQQKRVTMKYNQFFKPKPLDILGDIHSANSLASYILDGVANINELFKRAFNLEENNMSRKSLEIKKVIYSGPCTIVIWADESKTIVRCQDGDRYSKEVGLLMCLAKKVWGTNASGSNFNDYISKAISEKEENE
mgnify:CR=1 FL=1